MRFPSIPTLIRGFSLYNLNFTTPVGVRSVHKLAHQSSLSRNMTMRSMPTIPFLGALFGSGQARDMTKYPGAQPEEFWQAKLTPDQFKVIREKETERPYDNAYDQHMPTEGVYVCSRHWLISISFCSSPYFYILLLTTSPYSNAQPAKYHFIAQTTNSNPVAVGRPTSIVFQAPSSVTTITV